MNPHDALVQFGSSQAWRRGLRVVVDGIRTRWMSILLLTAVFTGAGGMAARLLPRTYVSEARLLARKNYVMPALAHPRRAVPIGADSPTQSAYELVLSDEVLHQIVSRHRLADRWDEQRTAPLRVKDWLLEQVRGPVSDDDKTLALVDLLRKKLVVSVQDEVVRVKATWSDAQDAVDIANSAVAAFLDTRRRADVQTIADTYAILQRSAAMSRAEVEQRLAGVHAVVTRESVLERGALEAAGRDAQRSGTPEAPAGDLERAAASLRASRKARESLETAYRAKLDELTSRLAERRVVETEQHPDVVALRRSLERLREEPADLIAARAAEARLQAEFEAAGGTRDHFDSDTWPAGAAAAPALSRPVEVRVNAGEASESAAAGYAQSLLKGSVATYQDLLSRLADVHIELQTAEAAFQYRYVVTVPARLPRKATSPNTVLMVAGAVMAGLAAGLVRAVFEELRVRALLSPGAFMAHLRDPAAEAA